MKQNMLTRRTSPAMVVAVVALISSLTGGAVAATLITGGDIKNGSITKKDLKKNSVNTKKVRNETLLAKDFAPGELKNGVQGIPGLKGDKGDPGQDGADGADGADATALWAVIAGDTGATTRDSNVTSSIRNSNGFYTVTFDRNVSNCAFLVTPGGAGSVPHAEFGTALGASPNAVNVDTFNSSGAFADADFTLAVFC